MAEVGQIIDDKYEILKKIGQGGMSKVYLAMDKRLNKQWAVKEIEKRAKDKNNEIVIQSAIAEANLIKQLDHPAIVRIVDIIDNGNVIYIIEDYIEGETLGDILERHGAQPQDLVIEWAMQLCEALEYLHTRKPPIIYRDMKPANVMLKPDGNIKVIDFGIAREYKEQGLADTVVLGTKGYAAPEQYGGKGQTTARTDIYNLGVTLYHLLTGHNPAEPPYEIYPIRHWNPQLSAGLEAIIQKCTQLNPDDRYQSCAELLYALAHYEEASLAYRMKQKKKLNTFIGTCIAAGVFLITGITGLVMQSKTNDADYNYNLTQAAAISADASEEQLAEKIAFYEAAIDIKKDESQAYKELISCFKNDEKFDENEEKILNRTFNANLTQLQEKEDYGELAYEVGMLYWNYYSYGESKTSDNQITRIKSAVKWFEDASDEKYADESYYVKATIYRDIGKFNRDINLNIKEATDQKMYEPYWQKLNELVTLVESDKDKNELVILNLYSLCLNSIETYARKFKSVGISEKDMNAFYEELVEAVNGAEATSDDTTVPLKETLISRFTSVEDAIANAYRE